MSMEENRQGIPEPVESVSLPQELASFLRTKDVACLMHETNQGTVFVVKLPGSEIKGLSGRIPMHVRHELHEHAAAPVIRTVIRIYDRVDNPLSLETFTNVEQNDQRADFARLALQPSLYLLFYDENLNHCLTKGVGNTEEETIIGIVEAADRIRARIPRSRYNFDEAKADILAATTL